MASGARATLGFVFSSALTAVARADPPLPAAPASTGPPTPQAVDVPVARPPLVTPGLARATLAAAMRAAANPETRAHLSSMAARARTSAVLPELFLRAARTTDDSLRLSPTVDDPYHYSVLGGAGLWLEARLVWHFDRLVFDRDEVSVERLRREHDGAMAALRGKVLEALFAWQRAVRRSEDPKAGEDELEQALLSRAEQEATLDVLTGGWFTHRGTASE